MKKVLFFFVCLLFICPGSKGQNQNNIWAFGNHGGFDFNSGIPTQFVSNITADMGCASVANSSGNLLFYTNGLQVWDHNNNIMPNGNGLMNGSTFTYDNQNVVIVPFATDTSRYYLFYAPMYDDDISSPQPNDKLYYSVVDVTLNGGLGDIVPGMKDIVVDSGFSTALTTLPGRHCNVWLLAHMRDTNVFKAYSISGASIGSAVVSKTGTWYGQHAYRTSIMKASSDDSSIALSSFTIALSQMARAVGTSVEVYHFDTATGIVNNCRLVDFDTNIANFNNFVSVCFSPDNSKLYAVEFVSGVYQYDLTAPSLAAITASKFHVSATVPLEGDVSLAPDGKLYVGSFGLPATSLDRIDNPNAAGAACGYVPAAITLTNSTGLTAFPQKVNWPFRDTTVYQHDTTLCRGDMMTLYTPAGNWTHLWQDHSTADSFIVAQAGRYWAVSVNQCHIQVDSFKLDASNLQISLGHDTAFCAGDAITLSAYNPNAVYLWNDGSTGATLTVDQSGVYTVLVTEGPCSGHGEISVNVKPVPIVELGADTTICNGKTYILNARADSNTTLVWQDGHVGAQYKVMQAGKYLVTATEAGCQSSDSVMVQFTDCNCPVFVPNAFTPNGDGLNDVLHVRASCQVRDFNIRIFDRWGQCVYVGYNIHSGWDGTFNGAQLETGTYFYELSFTSEYLQSVSQKGDITLVR